MRNVLLILSLKAVLRDANSSSLIGCDSLGWFVGGSDDFTCLGGVADSCRSNDDCGELSECKDFGDSSDDDVSLPVNDSAAVGKSLSLVCCRLDSICLVRHVVVGLEWLEFAFDSFE